MREICSRTIKTRCCTFCLQICEFKISPLKQEEKEKQLSEKYRVMIAEVPKKDASKFISYTPFERFLGEITMEEVGILKYKNEHRVIIKDVQSINSMVYATSSILGRKTMGSILYRCGMKTKLPFNFEIKSIDELKEALNQLSLFGLGKLELEADGFDLKNMKIILKNSPFCIGLPVEDSPACWVMGGILHQILQKSFGQKILSVKEVECVAMGSDSCKFEIIPLKSSI